MPIVNANNTFFYVKLLIQVNILTSYSSKPSLLLSTCQNKFFREEEEEEECFCWELIILTLNHVNESGVDFTTVHFLTESCISESLDFQLIDVNKCL